MSLKMAGNKISLVDVGSHDLQRTLVRCHDESRDSAKLRRIVFVEDDCRVLQVQQHPRQLLKNRLQVGCCVSGVVDEICRPD